MQVSRYCTKVLVRKELKPAFPLFSGSCELNICEHFARALFMHGDNFCSVGRSPIVPRLAPFVPIFKKASITSPVLVLLCQRSMPTLETCPAISLQISPFGLQTQFGEPGSHRLWSEGHASALMVHPTFGVGVGHESQFSVIPQLFAALKRIIVSQLTQVVSHVAGHAGQNASGDPCA